MASASVLLADDEEAVRDSLERALQLERLNVILARDGQEALDLLAVVSPDLMILDVSMPRVDGLEVCRRLRDTGDRTPVLMLTARDAVEHRVEGLDAGADDYLGKPFALAELKARVRALLRRVDAPGEASGLTLSDLRMDTTTYDVFRGERRIALTRTEFQLLRYFLENPRQVLSRTQLFEGVWGYDFGATSNSLGVHIGYLRRKLEQGDEPRLLHTIRGVGYILREPQ